MWVNRDKYRELAIKATYLSEQVKSLSEELETLKKKPFVDVSKIKVGDWICFEYKRYSAGISHSSTEMLAKCEKVLVIYENPCTGERSFVYKKDTEHNLAVKGADVISYFAKQVK